MRVSFVFQAGQADSLGIVPDELSRPIRLVTPEDSVASANSLSFWCQIIHELADCDLVWPADECWSEQVLRRNAM